jgi:hypothetical protein
MPPVETALTKYVFLDIVAFTKGRSVEAQSDLVAELNSIVKSALEKQNVEIASENTILLPTGDGICIALLEAKPFDIHLQLALDIVAGVSDYNDRADDQTRKMQLRLGINENIDNIVLDINGRRNVAGNGINMAQRILNLADGNQILVGQAVYEILSGREKYMSSLRRYQGSDKHDNSFPVYQYFADNHKGLNTDVPSAFKPREEKEKKLNQLAAYYIAHSAQNKQAFFSRRDDGMLNYVAPILLYFKASDSLGEGESSQYESYCPKTEGGSTTEEQYDYYSKVDFWVLVKLRDYIVATVLRPFDDCFEGGQLGSMWAFASKTGIEKLKSEWPDIYNDFSLSTDD